MANERHALATRAAAAVRQIDPRLAIIGKPSPWGGPDTLCNLDPLPLPGVVCSLHIDVPQAFPASEPTDHQLLLLEWFALEEK